MEVINRQAGHDFHSTVDCMMGTSLSRPGPDLDLAMDPNLKLVELVVWLFMDCRVQIFFSLGSAPIGSSVSQSAAANIQGA